jgi:hypothetical protein
MSSGAKIYIPSFIKIGSGIQKLIEGDSQTQRQHGDLISLLLLLACFPYLERNESRLMRSPCCLCVCESLPPSMSPPAERIGALSIFLGMHMEVRPFPLG